MRLLRRELVVRDHMRHRRRRRVRWKRANNQQADPHEDQPGRDDDENYPTHS